MRPLDGLTCQCRLVWFVRSPRNTFFERTNNPRARSALHANASSRLAQRVFLPSDTRSTPVLFRVWQPRRCNVLIDMDTRTRQSPTHRDLLSRKRSGTGFKTSGVPHPNHRSYSQGSTPRALTNTKVFQIPRCAGAPLYLLSD